MQFLPRRAAASLLLGRSTFKQCLSSAAPKKQVIFSGIQPTGVPHLGNYLGAIRQWVKLQNEAENDTQLFFSLVDLHAITVPQDPAVLRKHKKELLASLLAIGLDPKRSTIFYQSAVPQHSELMWILSCNASMGYLSRMTQWKSKLELPENASPLDTDTKTKLRLGLFSYPVLQAADVLLYRTTQVPVGEDQAQHLELVRECAGGFNSIYGPVFVKPETIISPAKRVMSLIQPRAKMSKSAPNPKSRILINDTREVISQKIKGALTDSIEGVSYDPATRPGVSNLIEIMHHMGGGIESCEDIARDCSSLSMRSFKERVAESIDAHITPMREEWNRIMNDSTSQYVNNVEQAGAERASQAASDTMRDVRNAVGL